jgi:hypothetical protein
MGNKLTLHIPKYYDKTLLPIRANRYKDWWEDNNRTKDHARHCLPLSMANSLGWYILSPGTFLVKWDGNVTKAAEIVHLEKSSHYIVDDHAAYGSFTVQPSFIPVTNDPGDFVFIKGIPNERDKPYICMEACIEAWWNVALFGLVYIITKPGEFMIRKGQPIAQMFIYHGNAGNSDLDVVDGLPQGYDEWQAKRLEKPKNFDYMRGIRADGCPVKHHITNWKNADKYGK